MSMDDSTLLELQRTVEQDCATFVKLIEKLRGCRGAHGPSPIGNSLLQACRSIETNDNLTTPDALDEYGTRFREGCTKLGVPFHMEEFAQALLQHYFKPITMPRIFGDKHQAAIAVCIWVTTFEHKLNLEQEAVCTNMSTDMKQFHGALATLQESYMQFRDRFFRRKLYARAEAKGKIVRLDADSREEREVCGCDVSGEIRARIFLIATEL